MRPAAAQGAGSRVFAGMQPEQESADVVVIGGGIAGLAAARDLARGGRKVVLLESRNRLGGRIHTVRPAGWPGPVELGAQFVHGGNADLWRLLRASHTRVVKVPDLHWGLKGGGLVRIRDLDEKIASVTRLIYPAQAGHQSFAHYFARRPAAVPPDAWRLAQSFVEGFEAAPMAAISARSLAGEAMDEEEQFVVPDGYDRPVAFLASECRRRGVQIHSGNAVEAVEWGRGRIRAEAIELATGIRRTVQARAAIVTLPLGVLQARAGRGAVSFHPSLGAKQAVIAKMGRGTAARLVFRFPKTQWRRILPAVLQRWPRGFGFIHAVEPSVPVWWALSGHPVVIGWAGGPQATALARLSPARRKRRALSSLARVLGIPPGSLAGEAVEMLEWDWERDPYARGAYTYTAAGQDQAARKLAAPLRGTLFFAGEATAEGSEVGTVHGALRSGRRAAREALAALRAN